MSLHEPPPPRKRTWPAFAIVGFMAGVLTVILAVILWKQFGGTT